MRREQKVTTIRVEIRPELLIWACERAGAAEAALREKYPVAEWTRGDKKPTLKQLDAFARAARVPMGYLFLPAPPEEKLPIRDLRTVGSQGIARPSPDLLEVVYLCQRRQEWYREYAEQHGEQPRDFVGSARLTKPATDVAAEMRRLIDFTTDARRPCYDKAEAMRLFIDRTEDAGILVMISGVVKNITRRPLDPNEFRGFALADRLAPLVFINGADSKAAQIFTLAHELAHLWLGESALSNASLDSRANSDIEKWCNSVAAEFLVPLAEITRMGTSNVLNRLDGYAKIFKVSKLVILRRLLDASLITPRQFSELYGKLIKLIKTPTPSTGGDFYNTLPLRASKRFVKALVTSTVEGHTLYADAFQMLGIRSTKAFRGIGQKVGAL